MIPTIGLMIGLYILARYSEMAQKANKGTKIVLVIFFIITVFCILNLLISGSATLHDR